MRGKDKSSVKQMNVAFATYVLPKYQTPHKSHHQCLLQKRWQDYKMLCNPNMLMPPTWYSGKPTIIVQPPH